MEKRSTLASEDLAFNVIFTLMMTGWWLAVARLFWVMNLSLVDLNPPVPPQCIVSPSGACILDSGRTFWNYNTDLQGIAFTHAQALVILTCIFYLITWLDSHRPIRVITIPHPAMRHLHLVNPHQVFVVQPLTGAEAYVLDDPQYEPRQPR